MGAFLVDPSTKYILIVVLVFSTFISSVVSIFIWLRFSPVIKLAITTDKISSDGAIFRVRIEITNTSKVRIIKERATLCFAEINYKSLASMSSIGSCSMLVSEWVSFREEKFNSLQSERIKVKFEEPFQILESTFKIDPSETKVIERIHQCRQNHLVQIGVQVHAKLNLLERMYVRSRAKTDQWTSTVFYKGAINE